VLEQSHITQPSCKANLDFNGAPFRTEMNKFGILGYPPLRDGLLRGFNQKECDGYRKVIEIRINCWSHDTLRSSKQALETQ